jgi:TetR/AcrR family transcriptional repressor of mexJK operon
MPAAIPLAIQASARSERKRQAILDAAAELFLSKGYAGTSMDEVAALAAVSKQTVYAMSASKEALFIAVVGGMTGAAGDAVQGEIARLGEEDDVAATLDAYADRQLAVVLTPRLMQLRRLVIGEAARFPDLGRALYEGGPGRAIAGLAQAFARWKERGLLAIGDPAVAAAEFNWLVMGDPVNRAMLLGDAAIPDAAALRSHAAQATRTFLAAYASR